KPASQSKYAWAIGAGSQPCSTTVSVNMIPAGTAMPPASTERSIRLRIRLDIPNTHLPSWVNQQFHEAVSSGQTEGRNKCADVRPHRRHGRSTARMRAVEMLPRCARARSGRASKEPPMYRRALVPTDGSELSRIALPHVARVATSAVVFRVPLDIEELLSAGPEHVDLDRESSERWREA